MPGESPDNAANTLERGEDSSMQLTLEYALPPAVKAVMDSYVRMANKMAIVAMCFSGLMVALASIIIPSSTTSPWSPILRALVYAGILLNVGVTALSLVFINKASYLPCLALALFLKDGHSWPYLSSRGEPMPEKLLSLPSRDRDFELMIHFGLGENMRLVWKALLCGCYLGGGTLFATVGVFMWLSESRTVAASLTVFVTLPAAWLLFRHYKPPGSLISLKHILPDPGALRPPSVAQCFLNIITYSYLNVLLLLVPIGWAVHFAKLDDALIFVFNFLAIVPLASLLGFATVELALRAGPTLGGLLNATFGNAVELIISIIALQQNQLRIVQASILGSFLSNCLLALGMCFFAGGVRFHEQSYEERIAQQQIALLSLSVFSIVVPTAFVRSGAAGSDASNHIAALNISRGTAVVLLICYAAYLFFQIYTHKYLYTLEASKVNAKAAFATTEETVPTEANPSGSSDETAITSKDSSAIHKKTDGDDPVEKEDEDEDEPLLRVWIAILLLIVVTVITGVTAEFLVSSIDGMTTKSGVNKKFVALILLPLVGNAAEHVTAVTVSVKNKLDLALGVAIGSSIQIFLLVLPFLVCLSWALEKELTLSFDVFETVVVTLAIIVVSYAIADGRTNWLGGFVLMVLYVIIAIATWFHASDGTTE